MVRAFKRIKEELNCGEVIEVNVITGDYKSFYYNIVMMISYLFLANTKTMFLKWVGKVLISLLKIG